MSDTPETDMVVAADTGDSGFIGKLVKLAKRLERERDEARREMKELKQAARAVLRFVPYGDCSEMHHEKSDMHSALDPCPVAGRYNARIDKLVALVKEEA